MRKIVVLRPGALGDAVVALPVLEALAAAHPRARRVVVGSRAFRLAVACGLAHSWVGFDDVRLTPLFSTRGRCEVVADADLCVAYGRGSDGALAAGLARSGARRVVAWPARPPPGVHVTDHLLGALEAAGCPAAGRVPRLAPQGGWLAAGGAFLSGVRVGGRFAAVHPGSGGRRKQWAAERFVEAAGRLGRPGVWLLGPAEREDAALRGAGGQMAAVGECLPLRVLAGVLARCDVYVGNDSGVSHLAAAVGAATVAVFGPTDPASWAPRGQRVAVVGGPGRGGLEAVGVAEVLEAVGRLVPVTPAP